MSPGAVREFRGPLRGGGLSLDVGAVGGGTGPVVLTASAWLSDGRSSDCPRIHGRLGMRVPRSPASPPAAVGGRFPSQSLPHEDRRLPGPCFSVPTAFGMSVIPGAGSLRDRVCGNVVLVSQGRASTESPCLKADLEVRMLVFLLYIPVDAQEGQPRPLPEGRAPSGRASWEQLRSMCLFHGV